MRAIDRLTEAQCAHQGRAGEPVTWYTDRLERWFLHCQTEAPMQPSAPPGANDHTWVRLRAQGRSGHVLFRPRTQTPCPALGTGLLGRVAWGPIVSDSECFQRRPSLILVLLGREDDVLSKPPIRASAAARQAGSSDPIGPASDDNLNHQRSRAHGKRRNRSQPRQRRPNSQARGLVEHARCAAPRWLERRHFRTPPKGYKRKSRLCKARRAPTPRGAVRFNRSRNTPSRGDRSPVNKPRPTHSTHG